MKNKKEEMELALNALFKTVITSVIGIEEIMSAKIGEIELSTELDDERTLKVIIEDSGDDD